MPKKRLPDRYIEIKEDLLNKCAACGLCVENCKVTEYMNYTPDGSKIIQDYKNFLSGGELSAEADDFSSTCMKCYGCMDNGCPVDLQLLSLNELVWNEKRVRSGEAEKGVIYVDHAERLARYATQDEYARITTPTIVEGAKVALFPGCNIYRQPDKVLNLLDIMDAVGIPYSFIPGIQYCCGVKGCECGDMQWAQDRADQLVDKVKSLNVDTLVYWCPTCACNMARNYTQCVDDMPFRRISFATYLVENFDRLDFKNAAPHKITLHEPCKTAYMGLDLDDLRNFLKMIPGTELVEMAHHHEEAICCGCFAVDSKPEVGRKVTAVRMEEAKDTGADKMLDVCHNCHWVFVNYQKRNADFSVNVENYSQYIAEALGIIRPDRLD